MGDRQGDANATRAERRKTNKGSECPMGLLATCRPGIVTGVLFLGSVGLFPCGQVQAQSDPEAGGRVVHLLDEPRHRTVHRDGEIHLLDVQINPGDTSLAHTHDAAILLTSISNRNGPSGGLVSSNTAYATESFTHQVNNPGPGMLRIIAMSHAGPPVPDLGANRPEGMGGEPQLENGWFRSYRIELGPGEETPPQNHQNSAVVVQVSDGVTHVTRADGITSELTEMGHWAWRERGSAFRIRNAGERALSVVVNEPRR